MSGRLETIRETVGKYRCDRCFFYFPVDELIEEEETGLVVDQKCADELGFNEKRRDSPRDNVDHHFNT